MADHSRMKLGKKPRRYDRRTLRLGRFLTPALAPPPPAVTNSGGVASWGMMLNGPNTYGQGIPPAGLGDCTIAGVAHAISGNKNVNVVRRITALISVPLPVGNETSTSVITVGGGRPAKRPGHGAR